MIKADKIRAKYITSLKEADNGIIKSLIEFAQN